jgi:hypothetical protein
VPYLRNGIIREREILNNVEKLVELTEALIKTESTIRDLEFQAKTIQYRVDNEQKTTSYA